MASTYRDTMQHYNGTDYDILLPKSAFATSVTLSVAGWSSNKTQRVISSIISADDDIIVSPAPASFVVYGNSGVYCSAQENGALTFTCSKIPANEITVNILLL